MNKQEEIIGLLWRIESPQREACLRLLEENWERFSKAWGSTHNHQAWSGGYLDHVCAVMRIACELHGLWGDKLPFSLSDALVVLYLHDLEKPWKGVINFPDKESKALFREEKIREYGIVLNEDQWNGMRYVEGEGKDYRSTSRAMGRLAAFCHMCDVASARLWWDV